MVTQISLTNPSLSTTTANLFGASFTYGWRNMTAENPSNSTFGTVESQFSGWENPTINLKFYIPIGNNLPTFMTWALWNEFAKAQYDGTASTRTLLTVTFGSTLFDSYAYSETNAGIASLLGGIPVQLKSYSVNVTSDENKDGQFWVINAQFVETK